MDQPITIDLTPEEVERIFATRNKAQWDKFLDAYEYLIENLPRAEELADYEKKFNYFYKVRRNPAWQRKYYDLFYSQRGKEAEIAMVLDYLFEHTGKVEASFASKLVATLDPSLPVIDAHVLSFIGRKLPASHKDPRERIAAVVALFEEMKVAFRGYMETIAGRELLSRFRNEYPTRGISDMKALDFILWQSGGKGSKKHLGSTSLSGSNKRSELRR